MASKDNKNPGSEQAPVSASKKPRLLFVDHAVPQYDVYAGSRTNFMYLELLLEMGFEITFLSENFLALEPYTTELRQMGIEMLVGDGYRDNWGQWLKENGRSIDYAFLHKPDPAAFFLSAIKRYSQAAIIYQCHDLHYLRLQRKAEIEGDKAILEEAAEYEKKEHFIFSNSDVLLTFSEVEESVIRDRFPDKPVFTVPLFFYRDSAHPKSDFESRRDLVFVGACAHSPNKDAVSWFCNDVFPLIQSRIPDIVFNVIGADPPREILALQSPSINIPGRVSEEQLKAIYDSVRLMVVPLRFGAGVKGKVIEAMYNGLPLVSTSIGLEGIKGLEDNIQARNTAEEFAVEVVSLYQDCDRLQQLSVKGAEFVENNFSLQNTMSLMTGILETSRRQAVKRREVESDNSGFVKVDDKASTMRLHDRLKQQEDQLSELEQKLGLREKQIDEILNSTSWKLSAPVRWAKQGILNLKNLFSG